MINQLIISRPQTRSSGGLTVLRLIDHLLRMFNTHPNRKRFLCHNHTPAMQYGKGVPSAVSNGQQGKMAPQPLPVIDDQTLQFSVLNYKVADLSLKPYFSPVGNNPAFNIFYSRFEQIGSDMGFTLV